MKQVLTAIVTALLCSSGSHAATQKAFTEVMFVGSGTETSINLSEFSGGRTKAYGGAKVYLTSTGDGQKIELVYTDIDIMVPCDGNGSSIVTKDVKYAVVCI